MVDTHTLGHAGKDIGLTMGSGRWMTCLLCLLSGLVNLRGLFPSGLLDRCARIGVVNMA